MLGGEEVIFEDTLSGPHLLSDWYWLNESKEDWEFKDGALRIKTLPGGIWGDAFKDRPAKNFLLRKVTADCAAVEATVSNAAKTYGEQAGLFWMADSNNYVKLVVEGMKDGSVSLIMAREVNGVAEVVKKMEGVPLANAQLRMEVKNGKITGMMHSGYCVRLVGTCDFGMVLSAPEMSVGVGAHGSDGDSRVASFKDFKCIQIAQDRVAFVEGKLGDMNIADATTPAFTIAMAAANAIDATGEGEEQAPAFTSFLPCSGIGTSWTFSSNLSAGDMERIQGMLGGVAASAPLAVLDSEDAAEDQPAASKENE